MHSSPATVAALLLIVAAASLIALAAVAVRPALEGSAVTIREAPGSAPRAHERDSSARRTPRRRAGRRTARPAPSPSAPEPSPAPVEPSPAPPAPAPAPPAPAPVPQHDAEVTPPETVVTTYYRALDEGRFDAAWTILSPAVRSSFGDFERWRDGYATTLSSSPRDIEVARDGDVATIAHELVTEDRSSCGPVPRRFAVRWKLVLAAGGWRAETLSAVKRAGREPAEACPGRHDAASAAEGR